MGLDIELDLNALPPIRPPVAASASSGVASVATAITRASAGAAAQSAIKRHHGLDSVEGFDWIPKSKLEEDLAVSKLLPSNFSSCTSSDLHAARVSPVL
tara:strand:+ start:205 stop:501 length:297 start_codon:yes stop_codon:yes gene_type:complete